MDDNERLRTQWSVSDAHALAAIQTLGEPVRADDRQGLWNFRDGIWQPYGHNEIQERLVRLSQGNINNRTIASVISMARRMRPELVLNDAIRRSFESLRINTPNGLLDLQTTDPEQGPVLIDHDPSDMFMAQVPWKWDPTATCPRIDAFLASLWDDDEEMVDFIHTLLGYCLLPGLRLKKAILLYSPQQNSGKSILQNMARRLVGDPQNCATISLVGMDNKRFDTANLRGKMLSTGADLADQAPITSGTFKSLTGGDVLDAEEKGVQGFQLYNYATFIFASNYYPPTAEPSSAYFSRWFVVPFPNQFQPTSNFDVPLFQESEMEGLLVKSVRAAHRLLHRGDWGPVPARVRDATKMYEYEGNTVMQFVSLNLERSLGNELVGQELYRKYANWVGDHGNGALSTKRFYGQLRSMNQDAYPVELYRSARGMMVRGLRYRVSEGGLPKWMP